MRVASDSPAQLGNNRMPFSSQEFDGLVCVVVLVVRSSPDEAAVNHEAIRVARVRDDQVRGRDVREKALEESPPVHSVDEVLQLPVATRGLAEEALRHVCAEAGKAQAHSRTEELIEETTRAWLSPASSAVVSGLSGFR